jgi:hypothetical protein
MNVYLKKECSITETSTADPDNEWDRPNTFTQWEIPSKAYLSYKEDYFIDRLAVHFTPQVGQTCYLVYAIYSTGNSFGHDEDGCLEFIDLFTTREKAEALIDALRKEEKEDGLTKYIAEDGSEAWYCIPWNGYFESLSVLDIEEVVIAE